MTETQGATAPATPAATPPAAAPAPAAASHQEPEAGPPTWLAPRLAEAKKTQERELLAELGVTTRAEAKAKLEKAAEAERASMTEKERADARIKELEPKAQQADEFKALFGQLVEDRFSALPEQARVAIDNVAEGDPKQRWASMQLLASAGMQFGSTSALTTGAPAVTPQPKPPATTVPPGTPQAPPRSSTPQSVQEKWQQLNETDPVGASVFRRLNAQQFREDAAVK